MIRITLNLSKHCVETELKRLFNQTLSGYFRKSEDRPELERKLELLQNALADFDFPDLRTAHKELTGGSTASIELVDKGTNLPDIIIDGHPIKRGNG